MLHGLGLNTLEWMASKSDQQTELLSFSSKWNATHNIQQSVTGGGFDPWHNYRYSVDGESLSIS